MTVTATVVKLEDGPRNAVFHLYATFSAAADVESAVKKVDVTTLSKMATLNKACTHLSLEKIAFSTTGGITVQLLWDATTPVNLLEVPVNEIGVFNFLKSSPIQNNSGAGKTGSVLLTTSAATAASSYDLVLSFRKKYE